MKISIKGFLKDAGAAPARQMRKEQRLEAAAKGPGVYEKPPSHPDRPSNMDRKRLEAVAAGLPDLDNPSKIAADLSAFKPPIPEGQEEGAMKEGPDVPGTILRALAESRPSAEAAPAPALLDIPRDQRPPEADTGLVLQERA